MEKVPAIAGLQWIKEGFAIFRKQPLEMIVLSSLYFFIVLAFSFAGMIGGILRQILAPALSMAFMLACIDIQHGKRVFPKILFAEFRKPNFKSLVILGLLYLLAAVIALLIGNLISGGAFWQVWNSPNPPDEKTLAAGLAFPTLVILMIYLAFTVILWFAAPLIAWQNMGVGKAIFFSVYAVSRAYRAFIVYLLACGMIFLFSLSVIASASSLLGASGQQVALIPLVLLLFVLLFTIAQCSIYPSYVQIFGEPKIPEPT